ncbi:hypothetical protein JOB34_07690 [Allobranchiibius sp. GilTou38]|nr:hypothetical protein [Allobranchiibius sp. GilTou38]
MSHHLRKLREAGVDRL